MPKIKDTVWSCTKKSRTKNYIGFAFENWPHKNWIFCRIIFRVRILNDYYIPRCLGEAGPKGRALTAILRMAQCYHARIFSAQRLEHFPSLIARTIIYHDDLMDLTLRKHRTDDARDSRTLVEGRNHNT